MRAQEFIFENKKGKVPRRHKAAQPGGYKFMDDGTDRIYHLNQIMKAAAMSDGGKNPIVMNDESFVGKHNVAYPYSELEHNMMNQAFKSVSPTHAHSLIRDHHSKETDDTHKISPVQARRDYRKKS